MVKTPRTRHSKSKREPVTIDLEAEAVRRDPEQEEPTPKEAAAERQGAPEAPAGQPASQPEEHQAPQPESQPEGEETQDGREEAAGEQDTPPAGAGRPSGGGAGRALGAGIAGGVIALVLGGALQWAEVLPMPSRENGADPAVEALRREVEAVRGELSQLREAAPTASSDEALEQALSGQRNQIAELRESVSALQQAVSAGEAGEAPGLQALEERISGLESRLNELSQTEGAGASADRVAALESELAALRETASATQETASANAGRLDELAGRLDTLAERVESQDEGPRLALVVAASALRSAVESGQPFASELDTYSALAPDAAELQPLRQYAQSGIPTRVELAEEAPEVASRIAEAASAPPQDAGFLDRLMASARSAVTVRPVGEVEGDRPEAIAARMEAAVQRGDYAAALAEYEALPPAAQAPATDFAEKLRARRAADELLENALSSALKPA